MALFKILVLNYSLRTFYGLFSFSTFAPLGLYYWGAQKGALGYHWFGKIFFLKRAF